MTINNARSLVHHDDELVKTSKKVISCPRCNKMYHFTINVHDTTEEESTGIKNILLDLPCKHKMVAYVDNNGVIRGTFPIDKHVTDLKPIDLKGYDDRIDDLQKKHERLIREKDYNNAFAVKKQIAALNREKNECDALIKKRGAS